MSNQTTNTTSVNSTMTEFLQFLKESHSLVGAKSFEDVLADSIKLKSLLTVYTEISLLEAKKIAALSQAVSNLS